MDKRIGVIGIVIEDTSQAGEEKRLLHEYSHIIIGRMGIPYKERGLNLISVMVDGTNDVIGALIGKLGKIKGLSVKSALSKKH